MSSTKEMILNQFDNGVYHSSVKVAYSGLFIDRDSHYPKTGGVHTSGVHLTNPGYTMLGIGTYNSIIGRIIQ